MIGIGLVIQEKFVEIIDRGAEMKAYLNKPHSGVHAEGEYDFKTKKMIVFKGAQLSMDIREYKSRSAIALQKVNELRAEYVKENILLEDLVFTSASTAGFFLTGRSTNGMIAWKNEEGISIGEIYEPINYL